ncbi:N-acetyltransferase family protein [Gorillibacterium sp. CAU 1737]|uniref:GNAT family N-acetyltransferase n=1 Tax=Gorillibacterium sp. CAU 1737 TaxID=3140362 RepID=UPI003260A33D
MLTFRDAVREDVPDLLRIYNHYVQTSTATFDLEPQTLEDRLEWFSHYGGSYPILIAEWQGQIAGYAYLSVFRAKPAYRPTAESSVYLDKAYCGQGIGKALLQELIQRSRSLGYHSLIACITVGNDTSVHLHEQFGYRKVGHFPETGWKFGTWHDVLFYQLMLEESKH